MCTDEKHSPLSLGSNFQNGGIFPECLLFLSRKESMLLWTFYLQGPSKMSKRLAFGQHISWSILNLTLSRAKTSLFTVQESLHGTQPPVPTNVSSPHDRALWPAQMESGSHQVVGTSACLHSASLLTWPERKAMVRAQAGGHLPTTNCTQATLKDSDQEQALWTPCCSFCVFPLEGDVIFHSNKGSS